jgi:ethanolamine ammonia-lyase small subunit
MQSDALLERLAVVTPARPAAQPAHVAGPARDGGVRRRKPARLFVAVDGSATSTRQLIWALQEAARRDAIVLAVAVLGADADDGIRDTTRTLLDAQLLHAIGQSGVHGRAQAALLDPQVFEALISAAGGADLVVVRSDRSTVLRPAVHRSPVRRPLARYC